MQNRLKFQFKKYLEQEEVSDSTEEPIDLSDPIVRDKIGLIEVMDPFRQSSSIEHPERELDFN